MKKLSLKSYPIQSLLSLCFLTLLSFGCGNKKNDSAPETPTNTAATPLNNSCANTQCDNSVYNQYNQYGWMPYPYNNNPYQNYGGYNYNYGYNYGYGYGGRGGYNNYDPYFNNPNNTYNRFCDCPTGFQPAYSNSYGLGCLRRDYYTPYASFALQWSWGVSSNSWINIPQISNTQGYNNSNSCYQSVLQTCLVDQSGDCGNGATCVASAGGSRLGICTRQ
ncbi:MAG: hypothetical protein ACOYOK_13030 [Pseudobdellovibrionaceae bacterium]